MTEVILSVKAKEDVRCIFEYTKNRWSKKLAISYVKKLQEEFVFISNHPKLGIRILSTKRTGYFSRPIESHRIIYKVLEGGQVRIIRILHRRMSLIKNL